MVKRAELAKGSIPPESSIRIEPKGVIESLEYAVSMLKDSAELAREMSERARAEAHPEAALEYELEAAGVEAHVENICKLLGNLRIMDALMDPRGNRAA